MAIQAETVFSSPRKVVVKCTALTADGAESAAVKVDKSALTGPTGGPASKLKVEKIKWTTDVAVRVEFDHTANDEIAVLAPGEGSIDFTCFGGFTDPDSAGGTGDIVFTTASGTNYTVDLYVVTKD